MHKANCICQTNSKRNFSISILIAIITFWLDFSSKSWANDHLSFGKSQAFIPAIIQFTLTKNTGSAFGIGQEHHFIMTMLALCIFLVILIWFLVKNKSSSFSTLEYYGYGLILGGASGNLFDRFTRGQVTDFLDFTFISFPIFNVADALIDIGAFFIIFHIMRSAKTNQRQIQINSEAEGEVQRTERASEANQQCSEGEARSFPEAERVDVQSERGTMRAEHLQINKPRDEGDRGLTKKP